ncbi:MarR family transcriptional regulator [Phytoactinopolyspora alkaliphila]|uniref:MarR family transcriptional regulator n=2 Tax=Phytoactinopolyspora alkaliphila TaxID=1783498 RepID=A0A6N9YPE8_9ACTN|nr:MarR family transcriptional regulator [Phytoactinopolyspora alkaliphila]NED96718.1 MarR family transcriptional regulator [Phytoactinopolyspora alkaliphila]
MARVTARLAAAVDSVLVEAGLTLDQWRVLTYLRGHDGATMSELSGVLSVTGPTLTRVVDRLTTAALAHRNIDPGDRRRVLVQLAPRGRALVTELRPRVAEAESRVLGAVPGPERADLADALRRMLT